MDDRRHTHHHPEPAYSGALGAPHWSPMLAGLPTRLLLAGGLIAVLWTVVGWSLQP